MHLLIAAPEGLAAVEAATVGREVTIVVGAKDEKLNEIGYIVPGLGDARRPLVRNRLALLIECPLTASLRTEHPQLEGIR